MVITDVVPVSVTNTSVISSGVAITQVGGTRYAWNVQDLAVGEGGVITITGQLSTTLASGTFTNTVEITTTAVDTDTTNNTAQVGVTVPPRPVLQSTNPVSNTHTAPLTTTVSATYDQDMDAATVTTQTFAVHAMQTGQLTQTYGVNGGTIADKETLIPALESVVMKIDLEEKYMQVDLPEGLE